jgi:pilus assembly protein CpaE
MVCNGLTTDLMREALRAGVKDVLEAPVESRELAKPSSVPPRAWWCRPRRHPPGSYEDGVDGELARVITVFSTKGGAGKSVIATNLAVVLAQRSEKPVVLVDADLQFGDIAVLHRLSRPHTPSSALSALSTASTHRSYEACSRSTCRRVCSCCRPARARVRRSDRAAEMTQIVEMLRQFCSYTSIVDTPAYFNDVVLGLIEISDDVLLVAGMDIPNIKNVKIGLQTLRLLNTPMESAQARPQSGEFKVKLDVGEVERTLGIQAEALIPSDVVCTASGQQGRAGGALGQEGSGF